MIKSVEEHHLTHQLSIRGTAASGKFIAMRSWMGLWPCNPFTLRVSLESIVCYFRTFVNNSGIKQKLSKYLKESCGLTSG